MKCFLYIIMATGAFSAILNPTAKVSRDNTYINIYFTFNLILTNLDIFSQPESTDMSLVTVLEITKEADKRPYKVKTFDHLPIYGIVIGL